jgi:hypothetical protein
MTDNADDLPALPTEPSVSAGIKHEIKDENPESSLLSPSLLESRISSSAANAAMPDVKVKKGDEDGIGFSFEVFLEQQNNESGDTSAMSKVRYLSPLCNIPLYYHHID